MASAADSGRSSSGLSADVELQAVDAMSVFKFSAQTIDKLGESIDNINSLSDEFRAQLRSVGNRLNEPDLADTAFSGEQPLWAHPASQDRWETLAAADSLDAYLEKTKRVPETPTRLAQIKDDFTELAKYLHLSQSTAMGSSSQPQATQSSGASQLQAPPPNQQAARLLIPQFGEQHGGDARRSPRSLMRIPARMNDYHVEKDTGPSPAKRKLDARVRSPVQAPPPFPEAKSLEISSDSSDVDLPDPQEVTKKAKTSAAKTSAANGKAPQQPSARSTRHRAAPGPPPPPTREERAQLAQAKKIPPELSRPRRPVPPSPQSKASDSEEEATFSPQVRHQTGIGRSSYTRNSYTVRHPGSSAHSKKLVNTAPPLTARDKDRRADGEKNQDTDAGEDEPPDSEGEADPTTKAGGDIYEGDIMLSTAAKASKLGLPVSDGYAGFVYLSSHRAGDKGKIKEKWRCNKCMEAKTASEQGKPSNLITHLNHCKGPKDAKHAAMVRQAEVEAAEQASTAAPSTTLAPSSYKGPDIDGWRKDQQELNVELLRRYELLDVVENSLPFTHPGSTANKKKVRAICWRAVMALYSATTVRRDLEAFHAALLQQLQAELQAVDTLVALQHDAWTNRGFQHSFVAVLASYVDSNWVYHQRLLSFDVVRQKHTGATFAGHLVRTVSALDLDDKWNGSVTSDSAGTNTRMMHLLGHELEEEKMQRRAKEDDTYSTVAEKQMRQSPSAFPQAPMRNAGEWNAADNTILCLNHHINLAVRDGFDQGSASH
ncbi:hypothetical protein OC844_007273 [Tilletia horrida]|nr:hypothetical protein OC844_007273 [Tilletia horrida]